LQKFTAPTFSAITKFTLHAAEDGERAGLVIMGNYYTYIGLEKRGQRNSIVIYEGRRQDRKYLPPKELASESVNTNAVWFKVNVYNDATCSYSYSTNGRDYTSFGSRYKVEKGTWIGAKVGIFCLSPNIIKSKGYADFDFFRVAK
jgi:beta-xylosidase